MPIVAAPKVRHKNLVCSPALKAPPVEPWSRGPQGAPTAEGDMNRGFDHDSFTTERVTLNDRKAKRIKCFICGQSMILYDLEGDDENDDNNPQA